MTIRIPESEIIRAANEGMDAFIQVFNDAIMEAIGGELNETTMQELNGEQITLLAYIILRNEVMDGGFVQLIHNGYGGFIFLNPFAKAMRLWGAHDFSKLVYKGRKLFEKYGEEKWGDVLSRLTFLLREANDDTCSKVNPYDKEYNSMLKEFHEQYGEWGERLLTKEEKSEAKKTVYLPYQMPEYKEICEQYSEEERKLNAYREQCKNEALELFSKWFYSLGF